MSPVHFEYDYEVKGRQYTRLGCRLNASPAVRRSKSRAKVTCQKCKGRKHGAGRFT